MTTSDTTMLRRPPLRSDGADQVPLRLRLLPRPRRVPWVVIGVLMVAGSALTFTVWASSVGDRQPVLVLRSPVAAGEPLTRAHLTTVGVGSDATIDSVPASEAASLVGLRAVADLPAGTLVTRAQFVAGPRLAPGEAIVGVSLAANQVPIPDLEPGDRVLAVLTPGPDGSLPADETGAEDAAPTTWPARIFAVRAVDDADGATSGLVLVSLRVAEADATRLAAAASADRLRLVLLPRTPTP